MVSSLRRIGYWLTMFSFCEMSQYYSTTFLTLQKVVFFCLFFFKFLNSGTFILYFYSQEFPPY